jgi:hypothetical protein
MECIICTEKYNKSKHSQTECDYCKFQACNSCWQIYLLNENTPKCMNNECGKEWTFHQMRRKFTQVFMNTKYKKHTEEVLYEKEKSLMPATQLIIENQIQIEKRIQEIEEINAKMNELISKKRRLEVEVFRLRGKQDFERKTFVRPCSKSDCRGFLSTQWKCGLCETFTCPECHENKGKNRDVGEDGQPHVCDPNNVATAKLISSDSKPCPKCHTNIFKIDGCDQMFCTICHTAFSWTTGRLETNIHNPHYFEWLRQNNGADRNALDIPCGRELTHRDAISVRGVQTTIDAYEVTFNPLGSYTCFLNKLNNYDIVATNSVKKLKDIYITSVYELIRHVIHLNGIYVNELNIDNGEKKQKIRIDFMRNRITEDEYKRKLQIENKKERKTTELLRVHQLLRDVVTEIIHRFISELNEEHIININILDEIHEIVKYVNLLLSEISDTYNSVCYEFNEKCVRVVH